MPGFHPPPGKYYIVNVESSPDGKPLATRFNGLYTPVNVTELEKESSQTWVISKSVKGLQGISPSNGQGLYIIPQDDHSLIFWAKPVPEGYVWSIKKHGGVYTIETNDKRFWGIKEAKVGESVLWQFAPEAKLRYWRLIPAS